MLRILLCLWKRNHLVTCLHRKAPCNVNYWNYIVAYQNRLNRVTPGTKDYTWTVPLAFLLCLLPFCKGKDIGWIQYLLRGALHPYAHLVSLLVRTDRHLKKKWRRCCLRERLCHKRPFASLLFHWTAFLYFCSRGSISAISVVNCVMECATRGLFKDYIVDSLLTHHLNTSGVILIVPETKLNKKMSLLSKLWSLRCKLYRISDEQYFAIRYFLLKSCIGLVCDQISNCNY